jgi:hypothetical protein
MRSRWQVIPHRSGEWWVGYFATGIGALAYAGGLMGVARADEFSDVLGRFGSGGLHFSQFWIQPTLETGLFYDSGVGGESSTGSYIASNIAAKSDFVRHALNFSLDAEHLKNFDSDADTDTNLSGAANARLDIRRDLVVTSDIRGRFLEDDPESISTALSAAEPVPYSVVDVQSAINKTFNHLAVSADVAYEAWDYDDVAMIGGGTLDQDFRDGSSYEVGGRVSYLFSPGYGIFVGTHFNDRNYNSGDSTGWRSLSGIAFELTSLLRGDVGVGYMTQDFDSGTEVSSFSYHVGLIWNPTMLMTVRLDGDRVIDQTDIAGSPGSIETSFEAAIDYEVLRTLVISPSVGFALDNYISSSFNSRSLWAGINADYRVNRFLSVGFDYRLEEVNYSSGGTDYDRHVVGINAKANF